MEMILHGQRIATNGDVRLVPTPEQWDKVAQLKGRQADKENNRLSAQLSFPDLPDGLPPGSGSRTGRRAGERESGQAAAGEAGRPRGLQSRVSAVRFTSARAMRWTAACSACSRAVLRTR